MQLSLRHIIITLLLALPLSTWAKCGGVDYSWGADALSKGHDYTVTLMLYIQILVFTIGGILSVIGALQIYFKANLGKGDITESILMLVGGILFLLGGVIVFPAFFGYNII